MSTVSACCAKVYLLPWMPGTSVRSLASRPIWMLVKLASPDRSGESSTRLVASTGLEPLPARITRLIPTRLTLWHRLVILLRR